jgi:ubiquinone/menaquinone biosynthesis C-methylase UbiE
MTRLRDSGPVAPGNEEAVRAWDTVLYERWKKNREVFVGALDEVTEEVFDRFPPPEGGSCVDIGCGFGETTRQLAGLVGPHGFALGTDSSSRFVEDARREAIEAGVGNVEFETVDAQTAEWNRAYDYAFSRMGTQFFAAPVPAMRAIRGALKPGGGLRKICWRRKEESPFWAETEQVVERFLQRPAEYEADTCGPGRSLSAIPTRCEASSRLPGSRRSSCVGVTSTISWARTWLKRSTPCLRSAPEPSSYVSTESTARAVGRR